MDRSKATRTLIVLIPAIALILGIGVGGSQETDSRLFDPVYQIYQYIKSYFYKPELIDDQKALYGAMKGVVERRRAAERPLQRVPRPRREGAVRGIPGGGVHRCGDRDHPRR